LILEGRGSAAEWNENDCNQWKRIPQQQSDSGT
jgi:hypothetical protein